MSEFPFDSRPDGLALPRGPREGGRCNFVGYWLDSEDAPIPAYAWILPRQGSPSEARVSAAQVAEVNGRRLRRITVDGAETHIYALVNRMLGGEPLSALLPTGAVEFRLRPRSEYVAAPWLMRLPRDANQTFADFARGAASAHHEAPSLVRALVPRSLDFLAAGDSLEKLAHALGEDCGFPFTGTGAVRLGAIEAHLIPGADADGPSALSVRATSAGMSISYRLAQGTRVTCIRARQMVGGSVVSDSMTVLSERSDDGVGRVDLPGPEDGPFSTIVSVWTADSVDAPLVLAHEQQFNWIRRIDIGLHVMDGTVDLRAPWLSALEAVRDRRKRQVAARVRTVQKRGRTEQVQIGRSEAWEELLDSRRELGRLLMPQTDGGNFFSPISKDGGAGYAGLMLWLREKAEAHETSQLWIVDPYFDGHGLEAIARMTVRLDVRVLCLDAATRLTAAAASIAPFVDHVQIFDCKTRFHDRYWFIVGAHGVIEGYLVSNSWSSAAQRDPLVLAPIAGATLASVWQYVAELLGNSEQVPIARPVESSAADRATDDSVDVRAELARALASVVGSEDFLSSWRRLSAFLAQASDSDALLSSWPIEQVAEHIGAILQAAPEATVEIQPRDRRGKLSHLALLRQDFSVVARQARWLVEYLHEPLGNWSVYFGAQALAKAGRADLLVTCIDVLVANDRESESLATRLRRADAVENCLFFLVHSRGEALSETMDRLLASSVAGVRGVAVGLLERAVWNELEYRREAVALQIDECLMAFERASPEERVSGLAAVVGGLRVISNRADSATDRPRLRVESDDVRRVLDQMFAEMIRAWPKNGQTLLAPVFRLVGGPIVGSWARSNHTGLFRILVEQGKASEAEVAEMYLTHLHGRISELMSKDRPFFFDSDAEMTEVYVSFAVEIGGASVARLSLDASNLFERAMRARNRAFARSRSYSEWARASETLLWLGVIATIAEARGSQTWDREAGRKWRDEAMRVVAEGLVLYPGHSMADWVRHYLAVPVPGEES